MYLKIQTGSKKTSLELGKNDLLSQEKQQKIVEKRKEKFLTKNEKYFLSSYENVRMQGSRGSKWVHVRQLLHRSRAAKNRTEQLLNDLKRTKLFQIRKFLKFLNVLFYE